MLQREVWTFTFANSLEPIYIVDHLENRSLSILPLHLGCVRLILVPHPIKPGEYARGVSAVAAGTVGPLEVPDEVLVGVGGALAGAEGRAHGVESLVDALLRDAFYVGTDGGYLGGLVGEVAHDGEDGGRRVLGAL